MKASSCLHAFVLAAVILAPMGSRGSLPRESSAAVDAEVPSHVLAWDRTDQTQTLRAGESVARFEFTMNNLSPQPVEVQKVNPSCGCTTMSGRTLPFTLMAGEHEKLPFQMNLAGKSGQVTKSIFVVTNRGTKTLLITANVPADAQQSAVATTRARNQAAAAVDRQAVFHGDCASCHARPAEGRQGAELYHAACAICHEAAHRASMVPDLSLAGALRDESYWREHITHGREGTLMPAFGKDKNGILTSEQIDSLVSFLIANPPRPPVRQVVVPQWIPYPKGTPSASHATASK